MSLASNHQSLKFGAFEAPSFVHRLTGTDILDVAHPISGWRRKICKRYLRWTKPTIDLTYRGFQMRLCPGDNACDATLVMNGTHPEEDELTHLENSLPDGGTFVDIGANIGLFSLVGARAVGPKGRVISFEPGSETSQRLKTNVSLNGFENRITVIVAGVGDVQGSSSLARIKSHNRGSATLNQDIKTAESGETVPVVTLLDALAEQGVQSIDFLKIDIEGYEDRALVPFFENAPEELLPKQVLIETAHQQFWNHDLASKIQERGFKVALETADNRIYARDR